MQHFRKEEERFVDVCTGWVRNVEQRFVPTLTYFLNPRERYILKTIVGNNEACKLSFAGGYEHAERKRALLYPTYFEPGDEDYEIALCHITFSQKFSELTHGQILGTLTGNGLSREVIGDILTDGTNWQFFIEDRLADYLPIQIEKIGRTSVRVEKVDDAHMILPIEEWNEGEFITSSLRLDTVLASVYNLSRQKVKDLIVSGQVKVNWSEETRPAFELEQEDMVSIRHFGRVQLMSDNGRTKKDKIKVSIRILKGKK